MEENLEDDAGYNYISGNFLIISGIAREKSINKKHQQGCIER